MSVNWDAVAERLRTVVHPSSEEDVTTTAERIGVGGEVLRDSLTGRSRLSSVRVIAALARHAGVDPKWILTGEFDSATHRLCLEGSVEDVERLVKNLVSEITRADNDSSRAER